MGSPVDAARALLGCIVTTRIDGSKTSLRLTEVEAYGGSDDPASHAYRGRTHRNASMFLGAGHLYMYRSYGIHMMANIVTGRDCEPGAVLLRAGMPTDGIDVMELRRGRTDHLCDGPGKLAQSLGLTLVHDSLQIGEGVVEITRATPTTAWNTTSRIGITRATDRQWRFTTST